MKTTFIGLIICLLFCSCAEIPTFKPNGKKILVRVTTYSPNEKHGDRWTRKLQSSTGVRLVDKQHVAVDPKVIPYFSKVKLPCFDYPLLAVDCGTDVINRKAARKYGNNVPVVDLFFKYNKDASAFTRKYPPCMEAIVYNN